MGQTSSCVHSEDRTRTKSGRDSPATSGACTCASIITKTTITASRSRHSASCPLLRLPEGHCVYIRPPWIRSSSESSQHGAGKQGFPCMDCTGTSFILGPVFPATQGPRGAVALQARAAASGELQPSLSRASFSTSPRTHLIIESCPMPLALGHAAGKGCLFSQ